VKRLRETRRCDCVGAKRRGWGKQRSQPLSGFQGGFGEVTEVEDGKLTVRERVGESN
jgi:hypothetical protein